MVENEKSPEYGEIESGSVEIIVGPKSSGKTDEMIRRLRRATYGDYKIHAFKVIVTEGSSENKIVSHAGNEFEATPVKTTEQLKKLLKEDASLVAIDNAQFLDKEIVPFTQKMADKGIRVIVAGLDTDFRGEPFGFVPILMAQADILDKHSAICKVCSGPASFTQRLINGEPAEYDNPIVAVDASEFYEARCRGHHKVSGKP
ncbi:thymidine kinase [Candidatus Woesebacteria bacterium]|nr:MAG: thymidine kinase [Candidatus Woesebacteria bacterium]